MAYIKLNPQTAEQLISLRPTAYLLLSLIHLRIKNQETSNNQGLDIGEAWVGDKAYCGHKEKIYRGDKDFLQKHGFVSFRGTKTGTIAKVLRTDLFDPVFSQEGKSKGEGWGGNFPDQNAKKGEGEGEATTNQPQKRPNREPIKKDYENRGEPKGEGEGDQWAKLRAKLNQIKKGERGEPKGDQRAMVGANPRATNITPTGFKNITAALQSPAVADSLSASSSQTISDLLFTRYGIPPDPRGCRSPTDFELKALDYAEVFSLNLGGTFTKHTRRGERKYPIASSWFKLFKPDRGREEARLGRLDQAKAFFADYDGWSGYSDEQKFLCLTSFCHHGKQGFLDRSSRQRLDHTTAENRNAVERRSEVLFSPSLSFPQQAPPSI